MSKQCRMYLLPSDIEDLVAELRSTVGIKIIARKSLVLGPTELDSPFLEGLAEDGRKRSYLSCYLVPEMGADIRMRYLSKQEEWIVSDPSEVVEFSGFDYDGSSLRVGRLYFQNDQLLDDSLWKKRQDFIKWADGVFRTAKKLFEWSKPLNAYLGEHAAEWRRNGGRLLEI